MAATEGRTCSSCGIGTFVLAELQGRAFSYRDGRMLVVPVSLVLPTCTSCGDMRLNGADAARFDEALEPAYQVHRLSRPA